MKAKLTVRTVDAIQPAAKDVICWDTDIPGFACKVTPTGRRTFLLFYRAADHTQRKPTIGTYPALKPEQARRIAHEWLAEVRAGGDPSRVRQEKRARRGEDTVAELFEAYCRDKAGMRSIKEVRRIFKNDIIPALGSRRADDVKRSDVNRLLDKVKVRSESVASRLRQALSAFYTWALPRLPDGTVNPVMSAVAAPPPAARERVLSSAELSGLWNVLEQEPEPWRTALRLLILTGQRRGEVFDAEWSEIDLDAAIWTIPADRAKNGKAHIVPLSEPAVSLLRNLPRSGKVFDRPADAASFRSLILRSEAEVMGARWREFNLGSGTWRLSRGRSSTKKATTVQLNGEAIDLLKGLELSGMLFPGKQRPFSRAATRIRTALDDELGSSAEPFSWHDLRRTTATGLQRLGVRLEVTEAVLNHVSGSRSGIVGVYQRYDYLEEKRAALDAWANEIVGKAEGANVVQLRA